MQLSDMKYKCNIGYLMSYGIAVSSLVVSKDISLEVTTEKPGCRLMSCEEDTGQNYYVQ